MKKLTNDIFIERAKETHNNKYDYNLVNYSNNSTDIKIICSEHDIFYQTPNIHLLGHGCPICKSSKGEKEINELLQDSNITLEKQKPFNNCKDKGLLKFDFYLSDFNMCIEYDGKHHYEKNEFFGGLKEFKQQQKRDSIKNIYYKKNNIKLLRIKYNENIKRILIEEKIIINSNE